MELKFLTPTEVWHNFNASEVTLDSSTTSVETENNYVCVKQYFTAQDNAQGSIRAYIEICYDIRWTDARPVILLLESYENTNNRDIARKLVEQGYIVGLLDYCGGILEGEDKTTFTQNLQFASYPECKESLNVVRKNARNSAWFIWSKISRLALSVLEMLPIVDKAHIGVIGFGEGAHVAWQVAGMDSRVRALVAIGDAGYRWASGKTRFVGANVMNSDEELVFSTGVGAETYAKFIHCPTFLIVSKSAYSTDVDRAGDILALVQSDCKQLLITNGNDAQLTKTAFDAIMNWLRKNFMVRGEASITPTAAFENVDGRLYLRMNTVQNATKIQVNVCYGEPRSDSRHWDSLDALQKVDTNLYTVGVPVYDLQELIVAYATFSYENGNIISTPIQGIFPHKLGITAVDRIRENYRIMYDGSMGLGSFSCLTKDAILDESSLTQAYGPFEIKGITVKNGGLSLCRSAAELKALDRTSTLHFDAYSPEARELRINMYAYPEMKRYTAYAKLNGGEFWQKILLDSADFKSDEGKTLAQFRDTKILAIPHAAEVIFNNFLWI